MGRTILITGATDGIGLGAAAALADAGHHVAVHGRNPAKLARVRDALVQRTPGKVEAFCADLSKLAQVRRLAAEAATRLGTLDVLINNAGVFRTARPIAANGLDLRFMVNTIAPWVLTNDLLESLSADARVINVSSAAQEPVDLEALAGRRRIADDFSAYAQSKLALTMWTLEPAAVALAPQQSIVAVNPGSLLGTKMVREGFGTPGKDIGIGVSILQRLAVAPGAIRNRAYFDNDAGRYADPHPDALDPAKRAALLTAMQQTVQRLDAGG